MKLNRRKSEGPNDAKSLHDKDGALKGSRGTTSTIGIGYPKKSELQKADYAVGSGISGSIATAVDSANEITVTTYGSSSRAKKVRFDLVEIRNYERIASDNPCCSSGPPIGIGWNHGDTYRESIDNYENNRGCRRQNLEIVLSRSEREALLLEWAIDMKTIAASTRAAMKTKFQRKQTVINSRKASKLEEVIETTSRKLKHLFAPKRPVNGAVVESFPVRTPEIYAFDFSRAGDTASITSAGEENRSHLQVTEPDSYEIENLIEQSFDIPTVGVHNEGDENTSNIDDFTLGATTLGNTSAFSPSIMEMEKFYQELELEMFGEEAELPSMVGQTLEVPLEKEITNADVTTKDNVKVQHGISEHQCTPSHLQSTHLEGCPIRDFGRDEFQSESYVYNAPMAAQNPYRISGASKAHQHYFSDDRYDQPPFIQGNFLPLNRAHYEATQSNSSNPYVTYNDSIQSLVSQDSFAQCQNIPFAQRRSQPGFSLGSSSFHESIYSQRDANHQYRRERGRSFDSYYDVTPSQNNRTLSSPAKQLQHTHSEHLSKSQTLPTEDTMGISFRYSDSGSHYRPQHLHFDEPRIHHMPINGRLSANEWMGGTDLDHSLSNNDMTVTITEDHYSKISERHY